MTKVSSIPKVTHSFTHNFAATKSMIPMILLERLSPATMHTSSGEIITVGNNIPRLNHDPETGRCLGLLVEGRATNMLLQSCTIGSAWTKTGVVVEDTTIPAPMAGQFAKRLRNTTENNQHWIHQNKAHENGKHYVGSCYLKYDEGGAEVICFDYSNYAYLKNYGKVYFNLKTGEVINSGGLVGRAVKYPNGWWRLITETMILGASETPTYDPETGEAIDPATDTTVRNTGPRLRILQPNQVETYVGKTTESFLVWGMQDEQSEAATSVIITDASQVVRDWDNVRFALPAFSDFTVGVHFNAELLNPDTDANANRRRNIINLHETTTWVTRLMVYLINNTIVRLDTEQSAHFTQSLKGSLAADSNRVVEKGFAISYNYATKSYKMAFDKDPVISGNQTLSTQNLLWLTLGAQAAAATRCLNGHIQGIYFSNEALDSAGVSALAKSM